MCVDFSVKKKRARFTSSVRVSDDVWDAFFRKTTFFLSRDFPYGATFGSPFYESHVIPKPVKCQSWTSFL